MPAQTRSRGKAPPTRTYHSSPAPAQLEFPRRRKVVKAYGRQPQSARSLRQSTLTQIGYVEPVEPAKFDMDLTPEKRRQKRRKTMGDTPSSSFHTQTITQMLPHCTREGDEGLQQFSDLDDEEQRGQDENSETSHTTGGQLPDKALSHVTDSRATSMVPQTPVHRKSKRDMYEVPSSQPTPGTPVAATPLDTERYRIQPVRSPLQEKAVNIHPPLPALPTAETSLKRPRSMVIEDSYSSAPGLLSSDPQQSPLRVPRLPYIKETDPAQASTELDEFVPGILTAAAQSGSLTTVRPPLAEIAREIPDSDDEGLSLGPTPVKITANAAPPSTPGNVSSLGPKGLLQATPKVSSEEDDRESESSDAELDPGSPTPVARRVHTHVRPSSQRTEDVVKSPSSYRISGASEHRRAVTPALLSHSVQIRDTETVASQLSATTPLESQGHGPNTPAPSSSSRKAQTHTLQVDLEEVIHGHAPPAGYVSVTPRLPQKSASRSSQPRSARSARSRGILNDGTVEPQAEGPQERPITPLPSASQPSAAGSSPSRVTRSRRVQLQVPEETQDDDVTQDTLAAKSQFHTQTQGLESQRVPLEVIRTMAPQTDRSDIIISIHPEPAGLIANGSKDHEFRNYKILSTVSRLWIYVTSPVCELRYMAIIGPAKQSGEIDDNSGIGNREFNAGTGSKFAYELLQVYQLNNPVTLSKMKENGWVQAPPQKYTFIPPAVVGQLLGNLQRELFPEESRSNVQDSDDSQRILSTPQQIEDQLRSDIIQSTQPAPEEPIDSAVVLSSQGEPLQEDQRTPAGRHISDAVFARPQLPASKTPTSVRNLATLPQLPLLPSFTASREVNAAVRPSQATTASQASSPALSPQKSIPRPVLLSSGPSIPEYIDDDSPVRFVPGQHYSLGSSQLRLPESLMVDDFRQPPEMRDSDEEDSDG